MSAYGIGLETINNKLGHPHAETWDRGGRIGKERVGGCVKAKRIKNVNSTWKAARGER